jgi:hypothetical protein
MNSVDEAMRGCGGEAGKRRDPVASAPHRLIIRTVGTKKSPAEWLPPGSVRSVPSGPLSLGERVRVRAEANMLGLLIDREQ